MERFKKDERALKAFANTVMLADVKAEDFDTVFYTGGHGPMWDLAESPVSISLLVRPSKRSPDQKSVFRTAVIEEAEVGFAFQLTLQNEIRVR